jgi:hypothetical protein
LPWITAVKPSCAYRTTFFQTFSTDPHVVSTSVQPRAEKSIISCTVIPNAGRTTTSSGPRSRPRSAGSLRNLMPLSRNRSLT